MTQGGERQDLDGTNSYTQSPVDPCITPQPARTGSQQNISTESDNILSEQLTQTLTSTVAFQSVEETKV